jgi:hypothetical protein
MTGRGFHTSDFIGTSGAGLAKLRAAKAADPARFEAEPAPRDEALERTSRAMIRELMREGSWGKAILAASRFPDLGDEAAAIHRGREAIMRPSFQRQLKRDPDEMLEEAKAALRRRFGL